MEKKFVENGIKRHNEDKKLIVSILRVTNPVFSEQSIVTQRNLGLFEKAIKCPLKMTSVTNGN